MSESITCSGNELSSVLSDIRARGGFIESLDTCVGGKNAQYGVKYLEKFPHESQCSIGTSESGPYPATPEKGEESAARNTTKLNVAAGDDKRAEKPKSVTDAPASISERVEKNHFNAGKEPENPVGKSPKGSDQVTPEELRAVKLASGGERQTESRVEDCHQHSNCSDAALKSDGGKCHNDIAQKRMATRGSAHVPVNAWPSARESGASPSLPHCPTCSGPVTQGMPCPICAGLERIRDGARRLRNRFRPSNKEARIPHND